MFVNLAVQFAVLTAAVLMESNTQAARTDTVKFCGRQLSEIMSRVCHAYNSPSWDVPTVVEQPNGSVRKRRQLGIADECCIIGCTWEQLSEYCSIVSYAYSESPQKNPDEHVIADRSAEQGSAVQGVTKAKGASTPVAVRSADAAGYWGEAGEGVMEGERGRGYSRSRARGRRCWCRRKRRSGRRQSTLMGPRKKCSTRCARSRNRITAYNVGKNGKH